VIAANNANAPTVMASRQKFTSLIMSMLECSY